MRGMKRQAVILPHNEVAIFSKYLAYWIDPRSTFAHQFAGLKNINIVLVTILFTFISMIFHPQSQLLANPTPQKHLMPSLSVDCVTLGFENDQLKILLIQHCGGPRDGKWALPEDFVHKHLDLDQMPHHVLQRLTGINSLFVEQLGAFGSCHHVEYRRIITIGYYALINPQNYELILGPGARKVAWFNLDDAPDLIFEHRQILDAAIKKVQEDLESKLIGNKLLPKVFTLTQLQKLYEAILGEKQDTRNFRRKIHNLKILKDTGKTDETAPYRAPKLFTFDKSKLI